MIAREKFCRLAAGMLPALLLVAGCADDGGLTVSRQWPVMGTFAGLTLPRANRERLDEAVSLARDEFARIEGKLSVFSPDSLLSRAAERAGSAPLTVPPEVAGVIEKALKMAAASDGAFDPTVGPLMDLWGFRDGSLDEAPTEEAIAAARAITGWREVSLRLDRETGDASLMLELPGMRLDLGGIAKGYALDRAYEILEQAGLDDFMLVLGGEIRCRGRPHPRRRGWRIGVRDPFDRHRLLGTLTLTDGMAVATSGNYERFVELDGTRYAHIMDPRSGRPVSGMAGVTVIAPAAGTTDALSTALFVLGRGPTADRLLDRSGAGALWIPDRRPLEIFLDRTMVGAFSPAPEYAAAVRTGAEE